MAMYKQNSKICVVFYICSCVYDNVTLALGFFFKANKGYSEINYSVVFVFFDFCKI